MINNELCAICGQPAEATHHLIFGNGRRELADLDGLTIPVCNKCHNMGNIGERIHGNPAAEKLSKMLGQALFEKSKGNRSDFIRRYGRNYL